MEKWKIQRDAESRDEILTYMQKVGKMTFTKGYQKVTYRPKKITK
jgi:hypothetical protein